VETCFKIAIGWVSGCQSGFKDCVHQPKIEKKQTDWLQNSGLRAAKIFWFFFVCEVVEGKNKNV
jgi:hypothetical protein